MQCLGFKYRPLQKKMYTLSQKHSRFIDKCTSKNEKYNSKLYLC